MLNLNPKKLFNAQSFNLSDVKKHFWGIIPGSLGTDVLDFLQFDKIFKNQ